MPQHWIFAGLRRQWPFMVVFTIAAGGVLTCWLRPEHWLRGVVLVAVSLGVAALLRLRLGARGGGWLVVRSMSLDVFFYVALGVLVFTFGVLVDR